MADFTKSWPAMAFEKKRLETFKKYWPYSAKSACNKIKMAESGFYKLDANDKSDVVQCFFCGKEMEGWDEGDDPWFEHKSHAKQCEFAKAGKPEDEYTFKEFLDLVKSATKRMLEKAIDNENLDKVNVSDDSE